MRTVNDFKDFELLGASKGQKAEKWGKYILIRPDPQIIWEDSSFEKNYNIAHARYDRSSKGGGAWNVLKNIQDSWVIGYKNLKFNVKTMGFKHTGIFPEQATNWNYIMQKIKEKKSSNNACDIKVLNLFAYTGAATVASLYAGASVTHVDSSQGIVNLAKENVLLNKLENRNIRYIVDDVIKFLKREDRRNNKYDIIIMDPPSYGRGKNGEVFSIEKDFFELSKLVLQVLSKEPIFIMVNTYTGGLSSTIIENCIKILIDNGSYYNKDNLKYTLSSDEIGVKVKDKDIYLPCGVTTILEFCQKNK